MSKTLSYLFLGLFSLLLLLPGVIKIPVIDRDEAHFAQGTREMLQTGNFFQIRFQDKPRFQKPPGINWLQAIFVSSMSSPNSSDIWPYRMPSILSALIAVWLTYFLSMKITGKQASSIFAAGFLCSSFLFVVEAQMAVIDLALLTSVLLMYCCLWMIYQQRIGDELKEQQSHQYGWAFGFWMALTYGCLLKGVTLLMGCLSIVTLCLIERRTNWLKGLLIPYGLALFLLLTMGWLFFVNQAENSNYLWQMLQKDLFPKLSFLKSGGDSSHGKPPLFHLFSLALTFWPASLFLYQGVRYSWTNKKQKNVIFLIAWIIPSWIFFELMPTKLPQYVLPTFPALALLCALGVEQSAAVGGGLRVLQLLWATLSIIVAFSIILLPLILIKQIPLICLLAFIVLSVMSIICLYYTWVLDFHRASIVVMIMAIFFYPLLFSQLLPQLKPLWLTRNIARLIINLPQYNKISSDNPILAVGFDEPSLVFYFNTHLLRYTDGKTAETLLNKNPSTIAVVENKLLKGLKLQSLKLTVLGRIRGYNYNKGQMINLSVVSPSRALS